MTTERSTSAAIEQAHRSADGAPDSRFCTQPESEIFTKLDNVKSRISWTAERRQRLQQMWMRGDRAADIATALGCKVGAVNVARARFGLKPRRVVPGRPQEADEPTHKIERVAFITSRLMEFCTEKELVAQTGHSSYEWPRVVIKELVDNGIDACEEADIAPVIKVAITIGKSGRPTRIIVEDNGPGIPPETIGGNTRPVRPELLGVIGEEHLRRLSVAGGGEEQSFKYCCFPGHHDNGLPYVVEIATCALKQWVTGKVGAPGRLLITGVNFSATLENPFESFKGMEGMEEILTELRAGKYAPVIVCVHYVCPHIEYLDRGKSRIGLE
jgi:hypothetical protein